MSRWASACSSDNYIDRSATVTFPQAPTCLPQTHSSFTAADEKLALTLHHRGVSLLHVEHAILLGALRKYAAVHQNENGGRGTPISSLHYFANLFEEVQQEISPQYWNYVAHKVNRFEQTELWAIPGRTLEK